MSKRSILARLAILVPALVLGAAMLSTMSCGGGIFSETNSSSATPTASPGTGAFAYVTDIATGKLVPFARNTSTGTLTRGSAVKAGATGNGTGPSGIAVPSNNSFVYVANSADDKIYAYSIGNKGSPSPLATPSFDEGAGTSPQQLVSNSASSFLWVANTGKGSISTWTIGANGELSGQTSISNQNLVNPFGLVVDNFSGFLYVADSGSGMVSSFAINGSGQLSFVSAVPSMGPNLPGKPTKIVLDPSRAFLYVADFTTGAISSIGTNSGVLTQAVSQFGSSNQPFGLGVAQPPALGSPFLLEANQNVAVNNITANQLSGGTVLPPNSFGNNVSVPTGLVVDPQNAFFYTADQGDGTVAQWSLNAAGCAGLVCFVSKIFTEGSNPNSKPFEVMLTN